MKPFIFAVSIAVLLSSTPAFAQEANLDEEGAIVTTTSVTTTTATKKPAAVAENWELCPQPDQALASVPAAAEQLQADIDRYTLCLNRAELLLKLNEMKKGPEGTVDAMSLPGANTPIPLTAEQTSELINEPGTKLAASDAEIEEPVIEKITVKDIRGSNGELTARVTNTDGDIEMVKVGDTLSDGSEVTSITATQVSVRNKGKTERLEWGK